MKWFKRIFTSDDLSVDPAKKESKVNVTGNSGDTTHVELIGKSDILQKELNEQLRTAIADGREDLTRECLAKGADVNVKSGFWSYAPLHDAVFPHINGGTVILPKKGIVELLLSSGPDVNVRDSLGRTPLHLAVTKDNNEDIVRILLSNGADVNAKDNKGNTPMECATKTNAAIIKADGALTCFDACKKGLLNELEKLLAVEDCNEDTYNDLLLIAIKNNRKDIVKLLILKGADVNAKDDDGWTPLHHDANRYYNDGDMAEVLLAGGANVDARDNYGETPGEVDGHRRVREDVGQKTAPEGMSEAQLSRLARHIEIINGYQKILNSDIRQIFLRSYSLSTVQFSRSLRLHITQALHEPIDLNEAKAQESLPHAIAWDVQNHWEESAYRVGDCWQKSVTAQFRRWYDSNEKSGNSPATKIEFSLLKAQFLIREPASRICFDMLLEEWPNTPLRSLIYGTLGSLSFMKCFILEGTERDDIREDAKRNLDLAISLSRPDDPTINMWQSIREKC